MTSKDAAFRTGMVVFAVMACLSSTLAVAKEGEFGIQIGALQADTSLSGDSQIEPLIGLRGGYRFSRHWGWMLDGWYSEIEANPSRAMGTGIEDAPTFAVRTTFEILFGKEEWKGRVFFNFGGGLVNFDLRSESVNRTFASIGVGQRLVIGEQKYFRWEFRGDHTVSDDGFDGRDVTMAQILVGLSWGVGGVLLDDDEDGVPDRKDKCPDTPLRARVDGRGCPIDSDGDGVPDGLDRCPDTSAGWPVDATGCPLDTDGDGVPDGRDRCPGTPAGATVDASGCPSDEDGDGVFDGVDRCPGTPTAASVDAVGCPLDEDKDGVPDYLDKCPRTSLGETVDRNGCPFDEDGDLVPDSKDECPRTEKGLVVDSVGCPKDIPTLGRPIVLDVNFRFDSADFTPNSRRILDIVADTLKRFSEIRLEIGGHTDSIGDAAYNLNLSERRANAVRDFWISKDIDPSRLVAKGHGESTPIADNDTPKGQEKNRRVELKRLDSFLAGD